MMETISVLACLAGLSLLVYGVVRFFLPKEYRSNARTRPVRAPRPLPPRNSGSGMTSSPRARTGSPVPRSLPLRRLSGTGDAGALGPRGVRPSEFPCCPYDKQRNTPGSPQVIFWDSGANCYRCSRGHRFKSNGKLI